MSSTRTMSGLDSCSCERMLWRPSTNPTTLKPAVWRRAMRMAWTTSEWSATIRRRFMRPLASAAWTDFQGHALRRTRPHALAAGDPAEVDDLVLVGDRDVVDARVGGDDHDQVGELGDVVERGALEVELRQLRHVLVVVDDLGAQLVRRLMIFSAGLSRMSPTPPL